MNIWPAVAVVSMTLLSSLGMLIFKTQDTQGRVIDVCLAALSVLALVGLL